MKYKAIVVGASAGGMRAIRLILRELPKDFKLPILIVEHLSPNSDNYWLNSLNKECNLLVKEADEKEEINMGTVYVAPPGYHLLVEKDHTISFSSEERINYSRPSIDVLFETAADAYGEGLIGIVLTGANADGARGLKQIKERGGLTIVQDPNTAEVDFMPESAIELAVPHHILPLNKIAGLLIKLQSSNKKS